MSKRINNHLRNGYSDYNLLFLKRYANQLTTEDKILDVGCGHCRNLYFLYKLGFKNLYGIDKNLPDLKDKLKDGFQVNFTNADITNGLPYDDEYFDVTLCNFVLMFIEPKEIVNVIADILRVTKGFCIIETQKQFKKSANSEMNDYDFKQILDFMESNTEFEVLDKKMYKEKIIARRVNNGEN